MQATSWCDFWYSYLADQEAFDHKSIFVKVHAPWKALTREAEALLLKMPAEVEKRM